MILPAEKPKFNEATVEKVFRYFLGDSWRDEYDVVLLGIRNPKINFYDDELAVYTRPTGEKITPFNFNADPSAYLIKGAAKAILKKGVHFYRLSYHKINTPARRRFALRPATKGEQLPVWRKQAGGKFVSSVGVAIDIHDGGSDSTWSEGCQTLHFSQYWDFIKLVGRAFGVNVPKGYGVRAEDRFVKGVGKIPYILIDQKDYNYIRDLDEADFDNEADLRYQREQFVNIPKVDKIKERPVEASIANSGGLLEAVEVESEEQKATPMILTEREEKPVSAAETAASAPILTETDLKFEDLKSPQLPTSEEPAQSEEPAPTQQAEQITNIGSDLSKSGNEEDQIFFQYLPDINNLKKWFYKTILGQTLANIVAWFTTQDPVVRYGLAFLLIATVVAFIFIVVKHRTYIFGLVEKAMDYKADRSKNSPVIVADQIPAPIAQVPRPKNVERARSSM